MTMRYFLFFSVLLLCGCSDWEDDDNNREVITIAMTMDVSSDYVGDHIDIMENSWINGAIDIPNYAENIISCVPSSLEEGLQTMILTIKRHLKTTVSHCTLGIGDDSGGATAVCIYSYEKESLDDPYSEDRNIIDVYSSYGSCMTAVSVQAPSTNKITIWGLTDIDVLEQVDVSHCPMLATFICTSHPKLQSVDLSNNPSLTKVNCLDNENLKEVWLSRE